MVMQPVTSNNEKSSGLIVCNTWVEKLKEKRLLYEAIGRF